VFSSHATQDFFNPAFSSHTTQDFVNHATQILDRKRRIEKILRSYFTNPQILDRKRRIEKILRSEPQLASCERKVNPQILD